MTRILYVNHVGVLGGAERSLAELIEGLDPARFTARLALPPGPLARRLATVPIHSLPFLRPCKTRNPLRLARYGLRILRTGAALARIARGERVAVLHANSSTAQLYARVAAVLTGLPAIWHCRDLARLGPLARWLAAGRTRVVAISDAVAERLRADGVPSERIRRVYNGIAVPEAPARRGPFRAELGLKADDVLCGTIGQLVPWKQQDLFLDAARAIVAQRPEAHFAVIGSDLFGDHPRYVDRLRRVASRGELAGRVFFRGFRDDVPSVLADLDVLLHPAGREPFGRVVAEAMALGRPCVAVNACGPAELIRNRVDGLLAPPDSPAGLAEGALELLANPDLARRLGESARERIESDFSPTAFLRSMEAVYADAAQL